MKKLEELFGMDSTIEIMDTDYIQEPEITEETLSNLERIDKALPTVKDLTASDKEMDELAELAIGAYKDLFDLGMNVEARFSSEIFTAASQMIGHAIAARTAKINKKLKTVELQLKKAKLDQESGEQIHATGHFLDRNELLQAIRGNTDE